MSSSSSCRANRRASVGSPVGIRASFEHSLRTSWRFSPAARPTTRTTRTDRFKALVFGCLHAPYTSPQAWDWLMGVLAAHGSTITHLICTGDWVDLSSVSHHPNEEQETCCEEYEAAARQSLALRRAVGRSCRLLRLSGNHEDRLEGGLHVPRRIRNALHWSAHRELGPEWAHWASKPYTKDQRGLVRVGPLLVHHGFDFGLNSDESESLQMIRATGWLPNQIVVRSHTHRPLPPTVIKGKGNQPLPWWYANVGHLGPTKPAYTARRDTSTWGHGCVIVEGALTGWQSAPSFDATLLTR